MSILAHQIREVGARIRSRGQRDADDVLRVCVRLPAPPLDPDLFLAVPQAEPAAVLHHVLIVLLVVATCCGCTVED